MNLEPYPADILRLQSLEGFYNQTLKTYRELNISMVAAYQATEKLYFTYFGRKRFSNYNSFRANLSKARRTPYKGDKNYLYEI